MTHMSVQGLGVGGWILDQLEALRPATTLATVSCRTDLLAWYRRRGYTVTSEEPLHTQHWYSHNIVNRHDLKFVKLWKDNK